MMKNLNRIKIFLSMLAAIVLLATGNILGQSKSKVWSSSKVEKYYAKKAKDEGVSGPILKGATGDIPSFDADYCSSHGTVDIVPDSWHPDATQISWTIKTFVGAEESHPSWADVIGSGVGTVFQFHTDRVEDGYFEVPIYFEYIQRNNLGLIVQTRFDYTTVYKTPSVFNLSTTNNKMCVGSSVTLTLDGSEAGMDYQLKDGGGANIGFVINGSGSSIDFVVSPLVDTDYYVEAVNSDENSCAQTMNNTVSVTVHNLPIPTASNDGPVCEGETINLTAEPDGLTSYSWTGPNGFTSSSQNPIINNTVLANAGEYTLTVVDANTCSNTSKTTVVINSVPNITAGSNSPLCVDATLNLTSTPSGGSGNYTTFAWTGPNSFTSADQNPTINNVTTAATGDYYVTVTDDSGCSSDATAFESVVVNERPTVSVSYNDPVCENTVLTLTAVPAGGSGSYAGFVWTKGGVIIPGETGSTLTIASAAIADGGVYGVTVNDNLGCSSDESTVNVIVHSLPVPTAGNDGPVCENDNVQLSGSPAAMSSYNWTGPDGFTSSDQNPVLNSVTTANAGVYTLVVEDANTCQASVTTTVVVNSNPTITTSSNSPICVNGTLNLTSTPNGGSGSYTTFAWTGPNTFISADQNPTISNVSLANAGNYIVTVTDDNGCSSDGLTTENVVVNARPTVSLSYNNPVCLNTTLTITATAAGGSANYVNYIWTKSGVVIPGETGSTLTIVSAALTDAALYGVIVEDDAGCSSDEGTINVVVHALPVATASNDGPACVGDNVILSGGPDGMSTYAWTGPNGFISGLQNPTLSTVVVGDAGTYTLLITDANTCQNSTTTNVVVNEVNAGLSVSAPAPGLTTICAGTSVTFNASAADGSGNYTYDFHLIRGGVDTSVQNGGSVTYTTNTLQDGDEVYVIVTDATNTCTDTTPSIEMTVISNPVPTLNITSAGGNVICLGSTVDFVASPAGFDRYVFMRNGTETLQDGPLNTVSTDVLVDGDIVSVIAYAGTCFGNSTNITMSVYDLPTADLVSDKTTVCEGEDVLFTATPSGTGPFNYMFYVDNISQGLQAGNTFTYSSTNDFSVYVEVYDGNNCNEASTLVNITISKPVAGLTSDLTTICENEEVTFTATGGVSYQFFVNTISEQGPAATDEFKSSSLVNNDLVTVEVTDAFSCTASHAGITMTVNPIPVVSLTSSDIDNTICAGDEVTFTATGGDVYEFYVDGTIAQASGNNNTYVTDTLRNGEKVSCLVSYSSSGCSELSSEITTSVNPLPVATLSVLPSNTVITGTNLEFTGGGGNEYEFILDRGGVLAGLQARSADNTYDSDILENGDIVIVNVYDGNNCSSSSSITLTILDGVLPLDVSATDTDYCEGTGGVSIYIATPQHGITYELLRTSDNGQEGASIMFDSANPVPVQWDNILGDEEYRVEAYYTSVPAERFEMNNRITITEYSLPDVYNITPTGSVTGCNGGVGHVITLNNSQTGVDYHLQLEGATVETLAGSDGNPILYSAQLGIGTYTITAENQVSECEKDMSGTFTINGDGSDVAFNLYAVNPAVVGDPTDGRYCDGEAGIEIELDGSLDNTVNYKLYRNGNDTGVSVPGANGVISFGTVSDDGTYTVRVESGTGCQFPMEGYVDVLKIANPSAYNLVADNNGHYCSGDVGVNIGLNGQEENIEYVLFFEGTTALDTVVGGLTDVAFAFDGTYGTEGTYSVQAKVQEVGCLIDMLNTIDVVIDPMPLVYAVTSDGDYCRGGSTYLHLPDSETDVQYRWHNDNGTDDPIDDTYGPWISGPGVLSFEIIAEGRYQIDASKTDGVTSCESTMTGTFVINEKPLPDETTVIYESYEGKGCGDGSILTVVLSEPGVKYVLVKKDGVDYYPAPVDTITGDGNDISFDRIVDTGNAEYTAEAILEGCSIYLNNSAFVDVPNVVAKQTVTGFGEICNGDPGVEFGLADSEAGYDYRLYIADAVGSTTGVKVDSVINSPGGPITFDRVTNEGEYFVVGTTISCSVEMTNRVELNVNPLPTAFAMTGSGQFCDPLDGASIGLEDSEDGIIYTLQYLRTDGSLRDTIVVTAGPTTEDIDFGKFTKISTYTVVAVSPKGCTSSMNGQVTTVLGVTPVDQVVEYDDLAYCAGSAGTELRLTDHEADIVYQVVNDSDGSIVNEVTGTGSGSLSLGIFTEGSYRFQATRGGDACITPINGGNLEAVTELEIPEKHNLISDNTTVCGSVGATVYLDAFEVGREYRIEDGTGAILDTITSINRDPISWLVTESVSGTEIYEVFAMSGGTCDLSMGTIEIKYSEVPNDVNVFTVDDATMYCEGSDSITIGIDNTQAEVVYMLVDTTAMNDVLDVIIGNGSTQTYTKQMGAGVYVINSTLYTTGCSIVLSDTVKIERSALPEVERDVYCGTPDEPECTVQEELCIDPTEVDVKYSLYNQDGVEVQYLLGNGNKLCFTPIMEAGQYTIQAESTQEPFCTNDFGGDGNGDGTYTIGHKDFGELVAFDDTLDVASHLLTDTVNLRANDELRYLPSGALDALTIPYFEDGYFEDEDDLIVDRYVSDFKFEIDPDADTNIRFSLLTTDPSGKEVEVVELVRNVVGVYAVDSITGEFTLNKTPGFFGKDEVEYVVYNIDSENYPERRDTATIYVYVGNEMIEDEKSFLIPNAFSPNGDDINDKFVISGINDNELTAEKSSLEVFNRWGVLVYRSKQNVYGEDDKWWDGTSTTSTMVSIGKDLPNGTYFYVFTVKVNKLEESGDVKVETKKYSGYIELRR
ncbi:T9SS type B sorting domain-containing protein [Labilibacter sediminis]|nr:T9SS type B sorting domain-containing protein [Labilibacter sediminis]